MEGANVYTALIAFVGGLASFLSPCVLPLVPGYISLISGVSVDHLKDEGGAGRTAARRAVILNSLAFNAGLSIIFLSLGAAAGLIGSALFTNRWVSLVAGLVIIGFGLQLIGVLKVGALYKDTRKFSDEKPRGPLGSLLLGVAFAAGWTPCIGPILGGIIGLAATSGGWQGGLVLSAFYAAGLAVPFLLTGLGINKFLGFYSRFRRHLHKVEVFSGAMLIVIGLMIATGTVTRIASLAATLPSAEAAIERWLKPAAPPAPANAPAEGAAAKFPPLPEAEFKTIDGEPFELLGDLVRALPRRDTRIQRDGPRARRARLRGRRRHLARHARTGPRLPARRAAELHGPLRRRRHARPLQQRPGPARHLRPRPPGPRPRKDTRPPRPRWLRGPRPAPARRARPDGRRGRASLSPFALTRDAAVSPRKEVCSSIPYAWS
jgi:cytochrome c-type biogenesis protein